jgi:hypothetical protein
METDVLMAGAKRLAFGNGPRLVTLTNLGGVNYTLSFPRDYRDETVGERCLMEADVGVGGPTPYRQLADIGLGRSPTHGRNRSFQRPLTVQLQTVAWQLPPGLALRRGEKPTDVRALIGTRRRRHALLDPRCSS